MSSVDSYAFPLENLLKARIINFSKGWSLPTITDFQGEKIIGDFVNSLNKELSEKLLHELKYSDEEISNGHKIGGFAFFTQVDPRYRDKDISEYSLLFQLDSDQKNGLMWGDAGVANFFIHPKDLKSGNLEKLVYNWDCT
jgi:uncharacterized protein YwqG